MPVSTEDRFPGMMLSQAETPAEAIGRSTGGKVFHPKVELLAESGSTVRAEALRGGAFRPPSGSGCHSLYRS